MAYNRLEYDRRYNATHKDQQKAWREANKDKLKEKNIIFVSSHKEEIARYQKEYYTKNKISKKEYDRAYYPANKARKHAQSIEWKHAHPEIISNSNHNRYLKKREHILEVSKKWKQSNPGKINAMAAKRRAVLLQATPPWLNRSQWLEIEDIFIKANKISMETGIEHHVDHIYPLQGKRVSGLHVPWNLQILTAHKNLSKSRKLLVNPRVI